MAKTPRTKRRAETGRGQQHQKHYTFGIYGYSGAGKTSLSVTAPKPMVLDSNQGLLAIEGKPGLEHVRSTPINNIGQFERAYDNFTGTGRKNWKGKFETVVMDHYDDIQAIVLDELNADTVARDSRKMRDKTEQQEWGIMGNRLRRYLRQYKSLPMHKIMIFGVGQDKESGLLIPSLQGSLRSAIGYYCDFIIYIRIGKGGKRYLHFKSTDEFIAKARPWWWTEDKIFVDPEDTQFMTKLFRRIAAARESAFNAAEE